MNSQTDPLPAIELLQAILARLGAIEGRLAEREAERRERLPRPVLARVHARVLAHLLPEVCAAVGSAAWSCRELLAECGRDRELARALDRAVGPLDANVARRLGCLLSAAEGHVVAGHVVTLHERMRDGAVWSVSRV